MREIKKFITFVTSIIMVISSSTYIFADTNTSNTSNSTTNPSQISQSTIKFMQVNVSSLNVRSGPGTNSSKIGSLSKGTKVEIVEQSGIWYKIKYKNGYGWCSGDYLKSVSNSTDQNKPTTTIKTMQVNTSSLNVRSGPGTNSNKIGSLSKGTKVEIVEQSGIWYKIKYKNGYGWCSGDYLKSVSNSTDQNKPTTTIKTMQVNISSLNVRSGPGTNSNKIGSLSKGTKVEIVEQSGIWYKIKYNNGYGWCSGDYLTSVGSSDQSPSTNLSKGYYLVISTSKNSMGYYKDGKLVKEFRVATGKSSTQTPKGKFRVVNKIVNRPYYKDNIPGGDPRNPLGKRWLGLQVGSSYGDTYGIHGTNNENSIGYNVSGGCVRMHNKDVEWLFNQVPTGTTVIISGSSQSYKQIASQYKITLE